MKKVKLTFRTMDGVRFYEMFDPETSINQVIDFLMEKYPHTNRSKPSLMIFGALYSSYINLGNVNETKLNSPKLKRNDIDISDITIDIPSFFYIPSESHNILPPTYVRNLSKNTDYARKYLATKMQNNTCIIITETRKLKNDLNTLIVENKSIKRAICVLNDGHATTFDFSITYNPVTKKRGVSSCVVLDSIHDIQNDRMNILIAFNVPIFLLTSTVCNLHAGNLVISDSHDSKAVSSEKRSVTTYEFRHINKDPEKWIFIHSSITSFHGRHVSIERETVTDKNLIELLNTSDRSSASKQKIINEAIYHHTNLITSIPIQKDTSSCFYYALHFAKQALKTPDLHSRCKGYKVFGRNTAKILMEKNRHFDGYVKAVPYEVLDFGFIKHTQSDTLLHAFNNYPQHQISQKEQLKINEYLNNPANRGSLSTKIEDKASLKLKKSF